MTYSRPNTASYTIRSALFAEALLYRTASWDKAAEIGEFTAPPQAGAIHLVRGIGRVGDLVAKHPENLWFRGGQIYVAYDDRTLMVAILVPFAMEVVFRTAQNGPLSVRSALFTGRLSDERATFDVRLTRPALRRVAEDLATRGFTVRHLSR